MISRPFSHYTQIEKECFFKANFVKSFGAIFDQPSKQHSITELRFHQRRTLDINKYTEEKMFRKSYIVNCLKFILSIISRICDLKFMSFKQGKNNKYLHTCESAKNIVLDLTIQRKPVFWWEESVYIFIICEASLHPRIRKSSFSYQSSENHRALQLKKTPLQ